MASRLAPFALQSFFGVVVVVGLLETGCARPAERPPMQPPVESLAMEREPGARDEVQVGYATWYGQALAGRTTASGERFDPRQMTAAHRKLAFGTWVEVEKIDTGETVRVRITDRGPFGNADRVIDLSRAAANRIGMLKSGVAKVRIRIVDGP